MKQLIAVCVGSIAWLQKRSASRDDAVTIIFKLGAHELADIVGKIFGMDYGWVQVQPVVQLPPKNAKGWMDELAPTTPGNFP